MSSTDSTAGSKGGAGPTSWFCVSVDKLTELLLDSNIHRPGTGGRELSSESRLHVVTVVGWKTCCLTESVSQMETLVLWTHW